VARQRGLIKRKLSPIRVAGTREGMTKTMAEAKH
jgi:hypothetical protein